MNADQLFRPYRATQLSSKLTQGCALGYHISPFQGERSICSTLEALRLWAWIFRTQNDAAWQRIGIHNKAGELTLEQLLKKAVDHLAHHLTFIEAKREALKS